MRWFAGACVTSLVLGVIACGQSAVDEAASTSSAASSPSGSGGAAVSSNAGSTSGLVSTSTTGAQSQTAMERALSFAPEVSQDELTKTIKDLEAFVTRYTFGKGDENARKYLVERLQDYGYTAELDPFMASNELAHNIIARKVGATVPDEVYIFSAHYDSTSNSPMALAPGADDNASGVAAVLEAARLFREHSFDATLWFVLTAAEEQGSLGSQHMVKWLKEQKIDVRGVIAPDMIGYWPLGDADAMDILGDQGSTGLTELMAQVATELNVAHKTWTNHAFCYGDDHTNFQEAGWSAISPMDCVEGHNIPESGETTPHYHMVTDTFDTLHMPFTTKVTGVIVSTFALLGGPLER